MKRAAITVVLVFLMMPICSMFAAEQAAVTDEWKDITDKVFANPADKGGWEKDVDARVFAGKDGNTLKIKTTNFGTILIDLATRNVYSLGADGAKKSLTVTKMIQREFGLTLVVKTTGFKIRCKMKEKVAGMKNIPGIKAM